MLSAADLKRRLLRMQGDADEVEREPGGLLERQESDGKLIGGEGR